MFGFEIRLQIGWFFCNICSCSHINWWGLRIDYQEELLVQLNRSMSYFLQGFSIFIDFHGKLGRFFRIAIIVAGTNILTVGN